MSPSALHAFVRGTRQRDGPSSQQGRQHHCHALVHIMLLCAISMFPSSDVPGSLCRTTGGTWPCVTGWLQARCVFVSGNGSDASRAAQGANGAVDRPGCSRTSCRPGDRTQRRSRTSRFVPRRRVRRLQVLVATWSHGIARRGPDAVCTARMLQSAYSPGIVPMSTIAQAWMGSRPSARAWSISSGLSAPGLTKSSSGSIAAIPASAWMPSFGGK